jgi:uncharacterized DUF497 family protein
LIGIEIICEKSRRHGLTQEEIEQAMRGKHFAAGPEKTPSGEKRWTATAHVGDKALLIVYTKRRSHSRRDRLSIAESEGSS